MRGFKCFLCEQIIPGNADDLGRHLRSPVHGLFTDSFFTCGQPEGGGSCPRTFNKMCNLTRHIRNQHETLPVTDGVFPDPADVLVEMLDEDDVGALEQMEVVANGGDDSFDDTLLQPEAVKERSLLYISNIKSNPRVCQTTVDKTVEHVDCLTSDIVESLKKCAKNELRKAGASDESIDSLDSYFDSMSKPFRGLETVGKQKRAIIKRREYVAPQAVRLGQEMRSQRGPSGTCVEKAKDDTFQLIPMRELFKTVLETEGVMEKVLEFKPSNDGVMRSFLDGSLYRERFKTTTEDRIPTIWLLMYYDDLELANPLGPHATLHKLAAFYGLILNIDDKYRSKIRNLLLLALAKTEQIKHYTMGPIAARIASELKSLKDDRLHISTAAYTGPVRIMLAQTCGDNLGMHSLLGFVESFSANFPCRRCNASFPEVRDMILPSDKLLRTEKSYDSDLAINDVSKTGINRKCELHELEYYHVVRNHTVDTMHDMFEGLIMFDVKRVLGAWFDQGLFKKDRVSQIDVLNGLIEFYDYGRVDLKNKPAQFGLTCLKNVNAASGQSAAEAYCLFRHLPLMVSRYVPEDDQYLELLCSLLQITEMVMAPEITVDQTIVLQNLISEHHDTYKKLFGTTLKPKHHFVLHVPEAIRKIGPIVHYNCNRFEGKNNFFKILGHNICNFRNITKSCAERHQIQMFNTLSSRTIFTHLNEVGPVHVNNVEEMAGKDEVMEAGVPIDGEVTVTDHVTVNGTTYMNGDLVIVGEFEEQPLFAMIVHIMTSAVFRCKVGCLMSVWNTLHFERHMNAYAIEKPQVPGFRVISVSDFADYHPYHATRTGSACHDFHVVVR